MSKKYLQLPQNYKSFNKFKTTDTIIDKIKITFNPYRELSQYQTTKKKDKKYSHQTLTAVKY